MVTMKASDALGLVKEVEKKEAEKKAAEDRERDRRDDETIRNAPSWARGFFDGFVAAEIKKAASEKRRIAYVSVSSPQTRVGKAEWAALHEILKENGFTVKGPEYHENVGHDPDWGHYDFSHWSIEIGW